MALRLIRRVRPRTGGDSSGLARSRRQGHAAVDRDQRAGRSASGLASPERGARSSRAWIMLVLVLGVAAVALLVMERSAGPPVPTLPAPPLEGEPDIYMESPVVSQYRRDGTLEYQLTAVDARHFQGAAITRLTAPKLTLFRVGEPPWSVSARAGVLHRPAAGQGEETVSLTGDVTLEYTRPNGNHLRLMTESLDLYPRRQYAETDEDVMIESEFGETTGRGLAGDLELGVLKIFSDGSVPVRTVLQPEQFK